MDYGNFIIVQLFIVHYYECNFCECQSQSYLCQMIMGQLFAKSCTKWVNWFLDIWNSCNHLVVIKSSI